MWGQVLLGHGGGGGAAALHVLVLHLPVAGGLLACLGFDCSGTAWSSTGVVIRA